MRTSQTLLARPQAWLWALLSLLGHWATLLVIAYERLVGYLAGAVLGLLEGALAAGATAPAQTAPPPLLKAPQPAAPAIGAASQDEAAEHVATNGSSLPAPLPALPVKGLAAPSTPEVRCASS